MGDGGVVQFSEQTFIPSVRLQFAWLIHLAQLYCAQELLRQPSSSREVWSAQGALTLPKLSIFQCQNIGCDAIG